HILTLSPPLNLNPRWFAPHTAYTIAKYNMSLVTLGLAAELKGKVAVNSLWPQTWIATAAIMLVAGAEALKQSRKADIMADAAQLLEFGADGKCSREIGTTLYAWSYGRTVRVDPRDNIWVTDKGSDMVV